MFLNQQDLTQNTPNMRRERAEHQAQDKSIKNTARVFVCVVK